MSFKEEKALLRKEIRRQRRALPKDERKAWDKKIEEKVLSLDEYKNAETVFCFVSYGGEPETRGILSDCFASGKRLVVPRCKEQGEMDAVVIASMDDLKEGMYGILEPSEGLPTVDFEEIDFAVVPALAFTPEGERLGQGGGYYDRFMARTKAFTCGICYGCFVLPSVPTEEFDKRVRMVVCE